MLTIEQCLGAHRPMTFVVAESDLEVLNYIYNNYKEDKWFVYSGALAGLVPLNDLIEKKFKIENRAQSTTEVFDHIISRDFGKRNRQFEKYLFLDSQTILGDSGDVGKIKNVLSRYQLEENFTVNMVFVSQFVCVPAALQRLGDVAFFNLPNEDELKKLSDTMVKNLELKKHQRPSIEVVNNLKGLTKFEVEQSYLQSYQLYKKIDLNFIRDYKKNAIAKTDLLSLSETDLGFGDIGGMDNLKLWIQKSYGGWTVKGKKFGLPLLKGLLLVGLPGCGKAQPLDSFIYTPQGSKLMGDMKVGDLVCTPDGGIAKVRYVTPQGKKDIYRIYFRDGAIVECCDDHLWEIKIRDKRHKGDRFILPLKEFPSLRSKYNGKTSNISIRVPDRVEFKEKKLFIDPYVMGAMIGNGSLGNEDDPKNRVVGFTSQEKSIVNKVRKELKKFDCILRPIKDSSIQFTVSRIKGTEKRNKFKSQLEKYGLLGKKSINKHVPPDYLYNSYENRIKLLNGLMDTDGNVVQNGYGSEYSTSSEHLSIDFKELIESLGGICPITSREPHYTKSGKKVMCNTNYRCWPKVVFNPFSLKRKRDKYITRTKYRKLYRHIEKIIPVGRKEAQCIGLDSNEKLYLTDNFVITHNSMIMKAIGTEWGLPVVDFDPSLIFSSRVGDSEQNMRRVLQIVENMSPCLSGDTRITLSDGQVTSIKELYDNQYRGTVISLDNNFNFDNSDILLITKKQSNDMYNIRTTINNIKATGNHEFPILRSNGEMHWIEVENLKKGDYIVCPREIDTSKEFNFFSYLSDDTRFYSDIFNKEFLTRVKRENNQYYLKQGRRVRVNGYVKKEELINFKFDVDDLSHVKKIARGKGGYQDSFITKICNDIPEKDLFYTLGLLWSDGNIGDKGYWLYDKAIKSAQKTDKYYQRNQNCSKFYGNDITLHEKVKTFFKKYFDIDLQTSKSVDSDCYITLSPPVFLCEVLRRIQKDLLSLSKTCQWAWLCGVLDGDGHIHKQRVNFSAVKYLNNEYIRDVLLRVGIPTLSQRDNFKNKNVELTSYKFIKKLHEKASLYHPKKIDHFNLLQESIKEPKCRSDSLDVRECLINLLLEKDLISVDSITVKGRVRKQSIISDKISVESRKIIHDYIEENRIIDIEKIRSVFNELNAGDYWFLNERFFFTSISEKNKIQGNHDVYDLCLNKNHNFIGNRMFTHNCILAIDEIEKGLAGMQSSTFSDSGVTARVIRSFLIWMQDCTKPVFVVATANNIAHLPPELINRFDETFFVNIPQGFERKDIFDIHIRALGRDPSKIDTGKLAELSKDLSGREIEQVLRESMYTAFHGGKELSTEIIAEILEKKTNLITTMAEQLKALLKWVGWDDMKKDGIRARFASPSETLDIGRVHNEIDDILKTIEGPPDDG